MIIVRHRTNSINDLLSTPHNQGVEIDVRSLGGDLIVQHDPFQSGQKFTDWISFFHHKLLILNVKEDGLEESIIGVLKDLEISSYFFLDQSFPSLYKLSRISPEVCSTRVSEFESIDSAKLLHPGWVWFDSHTGSWDYLIESFESLRGTSIKTCLVSPELQRMNHDKEMVELKSIIDSQAIHFDAICTKVPEMWLES